MLMNYKTLLKNLKKKIVNFFLKAQDYDNLQAEI